MNIVVLDGYTLNPGDLSWDALKALGNCTIHERTPADQIIPRLADAEIAITNKVPFSKETLAALPKLRFIGVTATGFNIIDAAAAKERQVIVANVPLYGTRSVAQHTFALLLELTQHAGHHAQTVRDGRWVKSIDWCYNDHPLIELDGLTMGIVGYGRIGREVARRAQAFGVRVIAASRTPPPPDPWCDRCFGMDRLAELLAVADFVLMALPLNAASRGLIDRTAFASMKPDAVIINVGRGATIDEQALFEACRDRRIGGAIIDTWYRYPEQGSVEIPQARPSTCPFHELDNVVMTPHGSAWSEALAGRRCRVMAQNLDRLFRGEPLINIVRAPLVAAPA